MGIRDGIIIAAIIATHMLRNDAAALGQVITAVEEFLDDVVWP